MATGQSADSWICSFPSHAHTDWWFTSLLIVLTVWTSHQSVIHFWIQFGIPLLTPAWEFRRDVWVWITRYKYLFPLGSPADLVLFILKSVLNQDFAGCVVRRQFCRGGEEPTPCMGGRKLHNSCCWCVGVSWPKIHGEQRERKTAELSRTGPHSSPFNPFFCPLTLLSLSFELRVASCNVAHDYKKLSFSRVSRVS